MSLKSAKQIPIIINGSKLIFYYDYSNCNIERITNYNQYKQLFVRWCFSNNSLRNGFIAKGFLFTPRIIYHQATGRPLILRSYHDNKIHIDYSLYGKLKNRQFSSLLYEQVKRVGRIQYTPVPNLKDFIFSFLPDIKEEPPKKISLNILKTNELLKKAMQY